MNRILIVEDDADISEIIAMNLQYSGYAYTVLDDGARAAKYMEGDHAYDLAILDIMLPGLDGFELLRYMQKYQIPVLYLTAKTDVSSKIKGLRDGAEDYLAKPFEVLELLVRIEKILKRTGKLDKVLHYRDIVIDLETHTVTKGSDTVTLQPIEYDLMSALIRHKNCSLSRERLLSEIWGYDYPGTTRTVDTHISNLRRKLDITDAIVSVPKIGYRLAEE
ncbi:MAG TPA: response regulator transcription factor [Clostridia bacterium]|nr:response regulator transcription factor [Clostridia bacterium]